MMTLSDPLNTAGNRGRLARPPRVMFDRALARLMGLRVTEDDDGVIGVHVPGWVAARPRLIDAVAEGVKRALRGNDR